MENASKALIIAGAILISILLISVGVLVMNAMNPMTEQAQGQSEGMAIKTFNAQFTAHEGNHRSAAQVRSLVSDINASNAANEGHQVTITSGTQTGLTNFTPVAGTRYTVAVTSYADDGFINVITITAE